MPNYSKYKSAIYDKLQNRGDHPTADVLYAELKAELPDIGIATVYRNLGQLEAEGAIKKLTVDGINHYDHRTNPHSHFSCVRCSSLLDLDYDNEAIMELGRNNFPGEILSCSSNFYGICPDCLRAEQ